MGESDDTETLPPLPPEMTSPLPRGCFLSAFLCGLVMLAIGYVIRRGNDFGGAARVGIVALIVVGILLMLPFGLVMSLRVLATISADRARRRSARSDDGIDGG